MQNLNKLYDNMEHTCTEKKKLISSDKINFEENLQKNIIDIQNIQIGFTVKDSFQNFLNCIYNCNEY